MMQRQDESQGDIKSASRHADVKCSDWRPFVAAFVILLIMLAQAPTLTEASPLRWHINKSAYSSRSLSFPGIHKLDSLTNLQGGGIDIEDEISKRDDTNQYNDLTYAAIGTLTFSPASDHVAHVSNAKIALNYNNNDSIGEDPGVWELAIENSGSSLAAAETVGSLCNCIILEVQSQILDEIDMDKFDDFLLSIAKGMISRAVSDKTTQDLVVPVVLAIQNEENNQERFEALTEHVQQYLNVAVSFIQRRNFAYCDKSGKVLSVQVMLSQSEHSETARDLSERFLANKSTTNLIPQAIFGELANAVHKNICKRLKSTQYNDAMNTAEWTNKHRRQTQDEEKITTKQPSQGFQRTVQSMMAMLFVDVEESLQEIESKIDEAYFELFNDESKDASTHAFGNDFDGVLNKISESFEEIIDGGASLSEYDREWANSQRLVTIEQITRTSIHRLYHSHLQNLREHFGQSYEKTLEELATSVGDSILFESKRKEAAKRVEQGFTNSAFDSIPQICRHPDGELCEEMASLYSCVESLRGLLEDMYEITSSRMLDEEEWDDIIDGDIEGTTSDEESTTGLFKQRIGLRQLIKMIREDRQKKGPAKWYERWAGKLLIIGLNYIQGWIALQTLRREARRRDQDLPKFPLF